MTRADSSDATSSEQQLTLDFSAPPRTLRTSSAAPTRAATPCSVISARYYTPTEAAAYIRCSPRFLDGVSLPKEPRRRVRFLRREEADRLIEILPGHMKPIVRFALATGCRAGEILGLEWSRMDLQRQVAWLDHGTTKNGDGRGIPLNADAVAALESTHGQHPRWCFTYAGKRIENSFSAWDTAKRRAGIEDFRFHDLRHTWASWHVQSGTSLQELMELGGWKSYEMVLRYAHLAPEKLKSVAQRIERRTSADLLVRGENVAKPATFSLRSVH